MKLTAKFIQAITKPGRYYDDAAPGLFVFAQSHTRKRDGANMIRLSFVQRLTVEGKRRDIGLGSPKWGAVTLTDARAKAIANYRIARAGGDPTRAKRRIPTFEQAVETVIAMHAETWKDGGKSEGPVASELARLCVPDYRAQVRRHHHHGRRTRDVDANLERQTRDSSPRSPAHRGRHEMGDRRRAPRRQSRGRCHRCGAPAKRRTQGAFQALPYDRVGAAW